MIQFVYDGTWEGFLCAVFQAYNVSDACIRSDTDGECCFYEQRTVVCDAEQCWRVYNGSRKKLGLDFVKALESAWLTHEPGIEDDLLLYTRRSFAAGSDLYHDRNDPVIYRVAAASYKANREAHRMLGFVRFRPIGRMYLADIEPTSDILPLIADHFADRFQELPFVIRDKAHMRALIWNGHEYAILPFERFDDDLPETADILESAWTGYMDAMAIRERVKEGSRRRMMPKKYWKNLTEVRGLL